MRGRAADFALGAGARGCDALVWPAGERAPCPVFFAQGVRSRRRIGGRAGGGDPLAPLFCWVGGEVSSSLPTGDFIAVRERRRWWIRRGVWGRAAFGSGRLWSQAGGGTVWLAGAPEGELLQGARGCSAPAAACQSSFSLKRGSLLAPRNKPAARTTAPHRHRGGCAPPSQVPSQPRFPHPPRRLSCPSALILSLPQKAVQKRRLPRAAARAGGAAGQGGKQAAFEGGGATPPSGDSAAGAAGLASAWNCFAGVRPAEEGWGALERARRSSDAGREEGRRAVGLPGKWGKRRFAGRRWSGQRGGVSHVGAGRSPRVRQVDGALGQGGGVLPVRGGSALV